MKCPNCGYESNNKFCTMCGTKLPEQSAAQKESPTPYSNNGNTQVTPPPMQGVNNQPVQNNPQNFTAPYKPYFPPAPKQYVPTAKNRITSIIIALIISVILIGITISIYSAISYDKNIIESFIEDSSSISCKLNNLFLQ